MKRLLLPCMCVLAFTTATAFAQKDVLERAAQLELKGQFKEAAATLDQALKDSAPDAAQHRQLGFELDRLRRIKLDFSLTQDGLLEALQGLVKNLAREEFVGWVKEGRFDSRIIDGQRWFMGDSVRNLYMRYPELNARRVHPKNTVALEEARLESVRAIKNAALAEKRPYVLPKAFRVTMTVTAEPNAAPAGETIRAWIPVPREYPFQGNFELLTSSSPLKHLDEALSPIRSAYLEQTAQKGQPTRFKLDYEYSTHAVWFNVNPAEVRAFDSTDPELKKYTSEGPHVVFTPELRALSKQIVGDETNPCLKAKKCFDWVAENIKYSYAIEYSTIRNISDYCRTKGYGDCGQEALLFIALCRLNGVPARWQSGWNTFSGDKSNHDWSEIYLAPYGWMPADPYMGIFAMRYCDSLKPAERREIRDFYFGGLDQFRMIANSDHSQALNPPKQTMRSDDVDFQRGELEYGNQNLYFDKFSYSLTTKEIKLP